jgi:hypothetical protein
MLLQIEQLEDYRAVEGMEARRRLACNINNRMRGAGGADQSGRPYPWTAPGRNHADAI